MDTNSWAEELADDEREVLDAGLGVRAPRGTKQAVWDELAAKLPALTAAGGAAATTSLAAASKLGAASSLSATALLKPLAVGLALGTATAAGLAGFRGVAHDRTRAPALSTASSAPSRVSVPEQPAPRASASAGVTPPAPAVRAPLAARAEEPPANPAALPPVPGTPSIASFPSDAPAAAPESAVVAESRLVAKAKVLLRAGDARGVLASLAELDRAYAGGVLIQEREALRIEALLALGDRAAARRLAESFLARYPKSPHAAAAGRALR
ncbi:MAG TPA: hypothetical protein VGK73_25455 [Polyangiaceae bacterium]